MLPRHYSHGKRLFQLQNALVTSRCTSECVRKLCQRVGVSLSSNRVLIGKTHADVRMSNDFSTRRKVKITFSIASMLFNSIPAMRETVKIITTYNANWNCAATCHFKVSCNFARSFGKICVRLIV